MKTNKLGILGALIIIWFGGFLISCLYEKPEVIIEKIVITDTIPNTNLMVTNQSDDSVLVWLTLSVYNGTTATQYLQNVNGVFGISQTGSAGSFMLAPNDTLSYVSTLALSGNFCFGGQAINCPNTQFPTGLNIFEFTLNNFAIDSNGTESVEISCMNGVNSFLVGRLQGENWVVTTGMDTVRTFRNATLGNNTNLPGVFPTGCTNCTNQQGATICTDPNLPFDQPNTEPICIISRPSITNGGNVICTFNGFTGIPCKK